MKYLIEPWSLENCVIRREWASFDNSTFISRLTAIMVEFWKSNVWLVEILNETKELDVFPDSKSFLCSHILSFFNLI